MIVNTKEAFADLLDDLKREEYIFFDTETTGLRSQTDSRACGLVFGFADGRTFYVPVRHMTDDPQLDPAWAMPLLKRALQKRHHQYILFHAKFDCEIMLQDGIDLFETGDVHCTMIAAHLIADTLKKYSLKSLGRTMLGEADAADQQDFVKETIKTRGYNPNLYGYAEFPVMELAPYAEQDIHLTRRLWYWEVEKLHEEGTYWTYQRERAVLPVVVEMEMRGVCIDRCYCERAVEKLERLIPAARRTLADRLRRLGIYVAADEWKAKLISLADGQIAADDWPALDVLSKRYGRLKYYGPRLTKKGVPYKQSAHVDPFNGSSKALPQIMHALGLNGRLNEKTGNESFDKMVMEEFASEHPFCAELLEYRYFTKLLSTYFQPFLEMTAGQGDIGTIHPEFDQIATRTGRFSCRRPNFQNLVRPGADDDLDIQVKRAIVPHPGYVFMPADYSAMEMSMLAHLAKERGLIQKLRDGWDAHEATAADMMPDQWEAADKEGRKELRQLAKVLNFGLIYGMGAAKLQKKLELATLDEAKELKADYFDNMPGVRALSRSIYRQLDIRQPVEAQALLDQYGETLDSKGNRIVDVPDGYVPPAYHGPRPTLRNAFGRLYHFNVLPYEYPRIRVRPDERGFWCEQVQTHYVADAHAALNYDDQGSCADLVKLKMAHVWQALRGEDAFIVMQVHDELVTEVREADLERLGRLCKTIMEDCPEISAPMRVEVSVARTCWAEKEPLVLAEATAAA